MEKPLLNTSEPNQATFACARAGVRPSDNGGFPSQGEYRCTGRGRAAAPLGNTVEITRHPSESGGSPHTLIGGVNSHSELKDGNDIYEVRKFHNFIKKNVPAIGKRRYPELWNKWDNLRLCGEFALECGTNIKVNPNGKITYTGVCTCSLPICPYCARLRQMKACKELENAVEWHLGSSKACLGGYTKTVGMMTLTARHWAGMNKTVCVRRLAKAKAYYFTMRPVKRALEELGYKSGHIGCRKDVFEVTWGEENGIHPHYHILFFFDREREARETGGVRDRVRHSCNKWGDLVLTWDNWEVLAECWQKALNKFGLDCNERGFALDVENPTDYGFFIDNEMEVVDGLCPLRKGEDWECQNRGTTFGEYLSKSGSFAYEMSLSHNKKAMNGRLSLFGLLHEYYRSGDRKYAEIWCDIVAAMGKMKVTKWDRNYGDFLTVAERRYYECLTDRKEFEARCDYEKQLAMASDLFGESESVQGEFSFDYVQAYRDVRFESLVPDSDAESTYVDVLQLCQADHNLLKRSEENFQTLLESARAYALGVRSSSVVDLVELVRRLNGSGMDIIITASFGCVNKPIELDLSYEKQETG